MSVQMVLLPVFVLVGLTFFLLLWMTTARTKAVKAGNQPEGHCGGAAEISGPRRPDRQLLQQPVRSTPSVLLPDRAGAAAAPCRSLHRADVLGVRGDTICPCRIFVTSNNVQQRSLAWFAGVLVLLAMWIYFALRMLLVIYFSDTFSTFSRKQSTSLENAIRKF